MQRIFGRKSVRRILASMLAGLGATVLAPPSHAADTVLKDAVELMGSIAHAQIGSPGMVIAVVRNGETVVLGYGRANEASDKEPDGNTLIHIGSISKVFTGATLASLVADGTVNLTDTLAARLGPGVAVPMLDGKTITLLDLATHASGLPREVSSTDPGMGDVVIDKPEQLIDAVGKATLLFPPGTGVLYSNFAFDLLGVTLGKAGGKPYEELLKERVLAPAGMSDTKANLAEGEAARAFDGHNFDGRVIPYTETSPVALGAGSLISTPNDMLKWLAWHLDRFSTKEAEMRLLDHTPFLSRDGLDPVFGLDEGGGEMSAMGLGWVVMAPEGNRPLILHKTGGYQGTLSYVAFAPTRGVGVFISMNAFRFDGFSTMVGTAVALIEQLAPR